jgi:hypothetical protein
LGVQKCCAGADDSVRRGREMTIATIRATEEVAAEIRYRIAQRLGMVTTARISGQEYTWLIQAA